MLRKRNPLNGGVSPVSGPEPPQESGYYCTRLINYPRQGFGQGDNHRKIHLPSTFDKCRVILRTNKVTGRAPDHAQPARSSAHPRNQALTQAHNGSLAHMQPACRKQQRPQRPGAFGQLQLACHPPEFEFSPLAA